MTVALERRSLLRAAGALVLGFAVPLPAPRHAAAQANPPVRPPMTGGAGSLTVTTLGRIRSNIRRIGAQNAESKSSAEPMISAVMAKPSSMKPKPLNKLLIAMRT